MKKIAILFPGQGSQHQGMGQEFYTTFPQFKAGFDEACIKLDLDLAFLCFEPNDLLNETEYAQVAITTVSALIYDQIYELLKGHKLFFAGHSLGEFTALYAAKVLSLETMTELVKYRGKIMAEQALIHPGKMAAVIGGSSKKIAGLCHSLNDIGFQVQVANYNLPNQTVVSGSQAGLEAFALRLSETDAKRFVYLKVSGAFHSQLMQEAADLFLERMHEAKKNDPKYPVIMNATARELDFSRLDEIISRQLVSPVRFYESIEYLLHLGIDTFIEVGPGNVLSNMVKKIAAEATVITINKPEDLELLEVLS